MSDEHVDDVMARIGLPPEDPDAADVRALVEYVIELGATVEEIVAAATIGNLGPLALDVAMRPPGASVPFEEFVVASGVDADSARSLWLAFGFPDESRFPFPVTPDIAEAMRVFEFMRQFGDDALLGLARVIGSSSARMADALANVSRVSVEVPQREGGMPFADVARSYSALARDLLPLLLEAIAAVFRRHLVLVSYEGFDVGRSQDAVILQRAIGFIDLVGSTEVLRTQSVAEVAESVNRFERLVGDRVTRAGGRVVKLIGDEAMFSFVDSRVAVATAVELTKASVNPVRVGLAFGDVVALHGDYFGPTVNLAARLVAIAKPSTVLVSASTPDAAKGEYEFATVPTGPLRGFSDITSAYEVKI